MCFLPLSADQPVVSMHLANLGLGVNLANAARGPVPALDAEALAPAQVRAAVREVLADPRYREAVTSVNGDFRRLPPVETVVQRLEDLCRNGMRVVG
jgi:UDP:flavonoid glycosyltransferase YjiC (YdhE family)